MRHVSHSKFNDKKPNELLGSMEKKLSPGRWASNRTTYEFVLIFDQIKRKRFLPSCVLLLYGNGVTKKIFN